MFIKDVSCWTAEEGPGAGTWSGISANQRAELVTNERAGGRHLVRDIVRWDNELIGKYTNSNPLKYSQLRLAWHSSSLQSQRFFGTIIITFLRCWSSWRLLALQFSSWSARNLVLWEMEIIWNWMLSKLIWSDLLLPHYLIRYHPVSAADLDSCVPQDSIVTGIRMTEHILH